MMGDDLPGGGWVPATPNAKTAGKRRLLAIVSGRPGALNSPIPIRAAVEFDVLYTELSE
jgi:hypothetical protein